MTQFYSFTHLLTSIFAELQALRNVILRNLIKDEDAVEIMNQYNNELKENINTIYAQMKTKYGELERTDDLLMNVLQ